MLWFGVQQYGSQGRECQGSSWGGGNVVGHGGSLFVDDALDSLLDVLVFPEVAGTSVRGPALLLGFDFI